MSFQDHGRDNVQSLLALLKSTQDDFRTPELVANPRPTPAIPSKRQLDDLLASLGSSSKPNVSSSALRDESSAFTKPQRQLLEPFGPVGQFAGPSRPSFDPQAQARNAALTTPHELYHERSPTKVPQGGDQDEPGFATLSFAKSLPVLAGLLADENFTAELRKMKADQDALERRLWAKQEKVKVEHEKGVKAERDMSVAPLTNFALLTIIRAKIARRATPAHREVAWAAKLASDLDDFYRQTCLVAMDGLSSRHQRRLQELGVPGLGSGDDQKSLERMRRIMDVLEAGTEE